MVYRGPDWTLFKTMIAPASSSIFLVSAESKTHFGIMSLTSILEMRPSGDGEAGPTTAEALSSESGSPSRSCSPSFPHHRKPAKVLLIQDLTPPPSPLVTPDASRIISNNNQTRDSPSKIIAFMQPLPYTEHTRFYLSHSPCGPTAEACAPEDAPYSGRPRGTSVLATWPMLAQTWWEMAEDQFG